MLKTLIKMFMGLLFVAMVMAVPAAEPAVKIGVLYPLTGPVSPYGIGQQRAVQMWAEEVNARGGLNGRPVELKFYDTEANGTKMIQYLRRLVESDQVDVIFGPSTSGEALLAIPVANEAKVPVLTHTTAASVVSPVTPYMFQPFPTDRLFIPKVIDEFKRLGYKNIGVLSSTDGLGQSGGALFKELVPKAGMTLSAEEFDRQDTDMTPQLLRAKQKGVDVLVVWGTFPGPPIIMRNAKAIGFGKPIYNSYAMTNKDFIKQAGGAAEGSYVVAMPLLNPPSVKAEDPSRKVVEKAFNSYVAKYKEPPVGSASPAFDAGTILEAAVKQIKGPITRQSIRDALEQTTTVGTNGTFRFSPANHSGLDEKGVTVVFVKIKGDSWVAE